ncbi:AraC family transcriptional regulator [Trinickia dabaoshanensis]|uniref:AraC family transcriptional regulator n=2 Tax=Trinickia dabaoshanensis TaxID=564714 RepID=A0A2N7VE82_9BURK|nr:AraC family transcriptional regulator [Trinickia dabaoshanensis]
MRVQNSIETSKFVALAFVTLDRLFLAVYFVPIRKLFVLVQRRGEVSVPLDQHLKIGGIIFPDMDQCDFTGPFEALVRTPNSSFMTLWKDKEPVRDMAGMRLLADTTFEDAPQLDVLLVPGGYGQEALMQDEEVLGFIRQQALHARYVYSVCTGALLCGAAGLLEGRRATTHWTALNVLPYFGAIPSEERVVIDGTFISAGGVTSGIDGSLIVVSKLRGEAVAQELQLYMAYDPKPPFQAGSPASAPAAVLEKVTERARSITEKRLASGAAYKAARRATV